MGEGIMPIRTLLSTPNPSLITAAPTSGLVLRKPLCGVGASTVDVCNIVSLSHAAPLSQTPLQKSS